MTPESDTPARGPRVALNLMALGCFATSLFGTSVLRAFGAKGLGMEVFFLLQIATSVLAFFAIRKAEPGRGDWLLPFTFVAMLCSSVLAIVIGGYLVTIR